MPVSARVLPRIASENAGEEAAAARRSPAAQDAAHVARPQAAHPFWTRPQRREERLPEQARPAPRLEPGDAAPVVRGKIRCEGERPEGMKRKRATLFEVDFALSEEGLGRFRVNVFHQRGNVAMVLRFITSDLPSLDDVTKVVIDEGVILGESKPYIIFGTILSIIFAAGLAYMIVELQSLLNF